MGEQDEDKGPFFVNSKELRKRFADWLGKVQRGAEVIVGVYKDPIARLIPFVQKDPVSPPIPLIKEGAPLPPEFYAAFHRFPELAKQLNGILASAKPEVASEMIQAVIETVQNAESRKNKQGTIWETMQDVVERGKLKRTSREEHEQLISNIKKEEKLKIEIQAKIEKEKEKLEAAKKASQTNYEPSQLVSLEEFEKMGKEANQNQPEETPPSSSLPLRASRTQRAAFNSSNSIKKKK